MFLINYRKKNVLFFIKIKLTIQNGISSIHIITKNNKTIRNSMNKMITKQKQETINTERDN